MKRLPSFGFLMLLATGALTIVFFVWGLKQPPLDRILELHHELKSGDRSKLSAQDVTLLHSQLSKYPGLAASLLDDEEIAIISAHRDGWVETPHVTVVRGGAALRQTAMVLRVETPSAHLPLSLTVTGRDWERSLELNSRGNIDLALPDVGAAELIQMHFKSDALRGKELRADPSALSIQVTFEPASLAKSQAEVGP